MVTSKKSQSLSIQETKTLSVVSLWHKKLMAKKNQSGTKLLSGGRRPSVVRFFLKRVEMFLCKDELLKKNLEMRKVSLKNTKKLPHIKWDILWSSRLEAVDDL